MQIRLTVAFGSRAGARGTERAAGAEAASAEAVRDVLVTAPSGTPLSAVTGALASAAATGTGGSGTSTGAAGSGSGGASDSAAEPSAVYAGTERLDPHRCVLGEPPLVDGAVLTLHGPAAPSSLAAYDSARARLHVIAGPDAGGVHLLQGGQVRLGRSTDADVPLDDPDVSRLHCAVTVTEGGAVTVTDLGSTNGTTLDGAPIGSRPVVFHSGATLWLGESAVRLEVPGEAFTGSVDGAGSTADAGGLSARTAGPAGSEGANGSAGSEGSGGTYAGAPGAPPAPGPALPAALRTLPDGQGRLRLVRHGRAEAPTDGPAVSGPAPSAGATSPAPYGDLPEGVFRSGPGAAPARPAPAGQTTHGAGFAPPSPEPHRMPPPERSAAARAPHPSPEAESERPRGRGLGAWARRLAGGRTDDAGPAAAPAAAAFPSDTAGPGGGPGAPGRDTGSADSGPNDRAAAARWPDAAAVLLTALGPGPRLWEREPGHPDAMTVRLGTAHRHGGRPAGPVTVDLRTAGGALGLAGPRTRLTGLARSAISQLAALHGPSTLEIVLLSADRSRPPETRAAEWSWLGWLPHLRPAHGQECRLLTAYDRDQAAARLSELLRRLDEAGRDRAPAPGGGARRTGSGHAAAPPEAQGAREGAVRPEGAPSVPPGSPQSPRPQPGLPPHPGSAPYAPHPMDPAGAARSLPDRPAPGTGGPGQRLGADRGAEGFGGRPGDAPSRPGASDAARPVPHPGPYTLLVVDGDPGSATAREEVLRLAADGPEAGIHVLCLAETPAATPTSPLAATIAAAHEASPAFRACGTLALLSGAVATAVQVVRAPVGSGSPASGGSVATVDAVSGAWAERFARALAPLREPEGTATRTGTATRAAVTLPRSARLLDELGLARATPAALLSRWAGAAGDGDGLGGGTAAHGSLVFGAGPRGPVEAELTAERGHVLVRGAAGAGKTELLRSLGASLAAGERPDRLRLVLVDGAGDTAREGLAACLELPHTERHLVAGDPVRMREFAQWLSGELKARAERIGAGRTFEEYARDGEGRPGGGASPDEPPAAHRVVSPRRSPDAPSPAPDTAPEAGAAAAGGASESAGPEATAPLPRLVVLVDDFDTLVDPALGNPGRPASGSVVRALDSVAREGARLGVHLVAATARPDRTAATAVARQAALLADLTGQAEPGGANGETFVPGRGELHGHAGQPLAFQAGRITGRIPRTSTLRPTVVPVDWLRAGDPPARRPVRELGNGPTDLALLASAISRAAQSLGLSARGAEAGAAPGAGAAPRAAARARGESGAP